MAFDATGTLTSAANEWGVDPLLGRAVAQTESSTQPAGPDSSAGAQGLMQLMPATAASLGVTNPRDPVQNAYGGMKYLSQMLDRYGDPTLALAAYNAGPGRVDDYLSGKAPLPAETQAYVGKVAAAYRGFGGGQPQGSSRPPGSYDVAAVDDGTRSDVAPSPLAPPSGGVPSTTAPADGSSSPADPFSHLLTAAGGSNDGATSPSPPPAVSPAPSAAGRPAAPGADPFSDLLTAAGGSSGQPPAGVTPSTSPAGPGVPSSTPPASSGGILNTVRNGLSTLGDAMKSATEGVANTAMRGAAFVDSKVPALANLDRSSGLDPQAGTQRLDTDIAATDAAHPNSLLYTLGKAGTDLAFTLPVMGGVGALAGAAGDALGLSTVGNALATASPVVRGASTLAGNALAGAGQGLVGAGLTAGSSTAPIGQQLKEGAELGGAFGAAAPALIGAGRSIANTALGGSITPETAALAKTAQGYGIPLYASQLSDSPFVRFLGDQLNKLPFSGAAGTADAQGTAMNRAIASSFGETADRITPTVMQAAKTRLGNTFDSLAAHIPVKVDPQLTSDLGDIANRAQDVLTPDQQTVIGKQLQSLVGKMQQGNGTLSGDVYQNLVSKGGALDDAMNNGAPGVQFYAGQIRDALEDAMQRSAPPGLAQQLSDARFQYKNLMTIKPLVAQAQGNDGNVSPLRLLQAVRSNFPDMAFSGAGTLGDLANIGQRFMKPPPDSGTATRAMILGAPSVLNRLANEPVSAMNALAATAGTAIAGRAITSYLRNPLVANRMIARGLAGNPTGAIGNALAGNAGVAGGLAPNLLAGPRNPFAPGP